MVAKTRELSKHNRNLALLANGGVTLILLNIFLNGRGNLSWQMHMLKKQSSLSEYLLMFQMFQITLTCQLQFSHSQIIVENIICTKVSTTILLLLHF